MGRFKAESVLIRRLPEVTITFYDRDKIYVAGRGSNRFSLFHRWYASLGSYQNNWKPFRRELLRQKNLNLYRCHELAQKYDVLYMSTDRPPELREKTIRYRDY